MAHLKHLEITVKSILYFLLFQLLYLSFDQYWFPVSLNWSGFCWCNRWEDSTVHCGQCFQSYRVGVLYLLLREVLLKLMILTNENKFKMLSFYRKQTLLDCRKAESLP